MSSPFQSLLPLHPSTYYNHEGSKDREWVLPALGEIVAVRYSRDEYWYRGRILGARDNIFQVKCTTMYIMMRVVLRLSLRRVCGGCHSVAAQVSTVAL